MKRIICCLDGTWDEPTDETTLTNVVKLHRAIAPVDAHGVRQLAHYEIGIATADGGKGLGNFVKGAMGLEVGNRIQSAYRYIVENYEAGDEIHLFGFSRGAFQARSLSGLIAHVGVARSADSAALEAAWQTYALRLEPDHAGRLAAARAAAHFPARVKCVGVWDTVGNIGIPLLRTLRLTRVFNRRFAFHDVALHDNIDVALHALSLDEPRGPFSPALWTLPRGRDLPAGQVVEQVWFPGSHCDVGGGIACTALSDAALLWMAERAHATTGLGFDMARLTKGSAPDPLGEQCSPTTEIYRVSRAFPYIRLVNQDIRAIPMLRRITFGNWRSSKLPPGERCVNESLHPSAQARFGHEVAVRYGRHVERERYLPGSLQVAMMTTPQSAPAQHGPRA